MFNFGLLGLIWKCSPFSNTMTVFLLGSFSYRWIRFEVCRPGDGQVPHSLSEDDASINFEAYQRHQGFDENIKTEHSTGSVNKHLAFWKSISLVKQLDLSLCVHQTCRWYSGLLAVRQVTFISFCFIGDTQSNMSCRSVC